MEAIYAIALLCQVASCGLFCDVDAYQLACQKSYVKCYERKLAEDAPPSEDPKVWTGKLKSCVVERQVD